MFMVGCASNKRLSETDQYKEMRKATIYKAYQKISIESMRPIVKEYRTSCSALGVNAVACSAYKGAGSQVVVLNLSQEQT